MAEQRKNIIAEWGERINWKKRVKAVCKPCWEIKYCPYGPLVEEFPIKPEPDSQSCRIFGHDCPVFHVAEPLTETKELRRVSRDIPRPIQFRVMKRENQICGVCGKPVQDEDIHFDHVIPHAKGGSSNEDNVRLLCDVCNQKRSDRYEAEFLVSGIAELMQEHQDVSFLDLLFTVFEYAHEHKRESGSFPSADDLSQAFETGKVDMFDELMTRTVLDFQEFFQEAKPQEMTKNQMQALAMRWGFLDGTLYLLKDTAFKFGEDVMTMVIFERSLLSRAGWYLKEDKHSRRKWADK